MKFIPRFKPDFIATIHPDSPEASFVHSVEEIASVYRYGTVFSRYHQARLDEMIESQNKPLYLINGSPSYGPQPSEEVMSAVWQERLLSYGEEGAKVVAAIGALKTCTDLLIGKQIDFCMPTKHDLGEDKGYINGSCIDYSPRIDSDPALFIQIGSEQTRGSGIHFSILSICNISISQSSF